MDYQHTDVLPRGPNNLSISNPTWIHTVCPFWRVMIKCGDELGAGDLLRHCDGRFQIWTGRHRDRWVLIIIEEVQGWLIRL